MSSCPQCPLTSASRNVSMCKVSSSECASIIVTGGNMSSSAAGTEYGTSFWAVLLCEIILGILLSNFIVCVILLDWVKGMRPSPSYQILIALAFSNIFHPYLSGLEDFGAFLFPEVNLVVYFNVVNILEVFSVLSSSWLTALLCLFYAVKILRFNSLFLGNLKMKIDKKVLSLILGTYSISFINSLTAIWLFDDVFPKYNMTSTFANTSMVDTSLQPGLPIFELALIISVIFPFLIVAVTTVNITWFLSMHTLHLKQKDGLNDRSVLKVHRKAAGTMVALFLLYTIFFTAQILIIFDFLSDTSAEYMVVLVVLGAFSPARSTILIWGNSRLSQSCADVIRYIVRKNTD